MASFFQRETPEGPSYAGGLFFWAKGCRHLPDSGRCPALDDVLVLHLGVEEFDLVERVADVTECGAEGLDVDLGIARDEGLGHLVAAAGLGFERAEVVGGISLDDAGRLSLAAMAGGL